MFYLADWSLGSKRLRWQWPWAVSVKVRVKGVLPTACLEGLPCVCMAGALRTAQ